MEAWNEALVRLLARVDVPVTFGAQEPKALSRWLVRAVGRDPVVPWDERPYLAGGDIGRLLSQRDAQALPADERERGWRYLVSDSLRDLMTRVMPRRLIEPAPDKFVYALCSVYALEPIDVLLYAGVHVPYPMRLWVNGDLIFAGSEDYVFKEGVARIRLRQGINAVLAEMPSRLREPLTDEGFTVKLQPLDRLLTDPARFAFIDRTWLDGMREAYALYPQRREAAVGDRLRVAVLPQAFGRQEDGGDADASVPVRLVLERADGTAAVSAVPVVAGQVVEIPLPEGTAAEGHYRLQVREAGGRARSHAVPVFVGDGDAELERLLARMSEREDLPDGAALTLRTLAELPERYGRLRYPYLPYPVRDLALRMRASLARFLASAPRPGVRSYAEAFPDGYAECRLRQHGEGVVIGRVHLPEDFDPRRRYPLVVYLSDMLGGPYPGWIPWLAERRPEGAIVADLVGIGHLNYADDHETVRSIQLLLESLPVDRSRIYAIGYCTGAVKAFRLGMCLPGLFAGIAAVPGDIAMDAANPRYDWLDNLRETPIYAIMGYEEENYNVSRTAENLRRLPRAACWIYEGFIHTELHLLHNSPRLLDTLLRQERDRFPAEIAYTIREPCWPRADWAEAEAYAPSSVGKAFLRAALRGPADIRVEVSHVLRFRLLLSLAEMPLSPEIRLHVGDAGAGGAATAASVHVRLHPYTSLHVEWEPAGGGIRRVAAEPLGEDAFRAAYDAIGTETAHLGIKRVYLGRCEVVLPERRTAFSRKLAYLLQNPILDRHAPYWFGSCHAAELDPERLRAGSLIVPLDTREPVHGRLRDLLAATGIEADAASLRVDGASFEGDYFAFLCRPHPEAPGGALLFVLYNNDRTEERMLGIMNVFERSPLFYADTLIDHGARYYSGMKGGIALVAAR